MTEAYPSIKSGDAVPNRKLDERGQVVELQLFHQATAVGFDRSRRQPQSLRRLGIGIAVGHQPENLALDTGQVLHIRGKAPDVATNVETLYRNSLANVTSASRHRAHRRHHLVAGGF